MYEQSHVFIISFYDNFISVIRDYINFTIKKNCEFIFPAWTKTYTYSIFHSVPRSYTSSRISTFSNFSFEFFFHLLFRISSHFLRSFLAFSSAKTNWQFYDIKFISVAAFTIPLYDDNSDEGHSGGFSGAAGGWGSWTKLLISFVFLPKQ